MEIDPLVPEKIFKGFTIYGIGGHLCHLTQIPLTNFRSPYPWRLHIKFGFDWPRKSFNMVNGRTWGRTPEHGYTVSSPGEPNGSGELKSGTEYLIKI